MVPTVKGRPGRRRRLQESIRLGGPKKRDASSETTIAELEKTISEEIAAQRRARRLNEERRWEREYSLEPWETKR